MGRKVRGENRSVRHQTLNIFNLDDIGYFAGKQGSGEAGKNFICAGYISWKQE